MMTNMTINEMITEMDDRMNAVNRTFAKAVKNGLSAQRQASVRFHAAEVKEARQSITTNSRRTDVQKAYQTVMAGLDLIVASLA